MTWITSPISMNVAIHILKMTMCINTLLHWCINNKGVKMCKLWVGTGSSNVISDTTDIMVRMFMQVSHMLFRTDLTQANYDDQENSCCWSQSWQFLCQVVLLYILTACEHIPMMVVKVRLVLKDIPRESSIVSYITWASKHTRQEVWWEKPLSGILTGSRGSHKYACFLFFNSWGKDYLHSMWDAK